MEVHSEVHTALLSTRCAPPKGHRTADLGPFSRPAPPACTTPAPPPTDPYPALLPTRALGPTSRGPAAPPPRPSGWRLRPSAGHPPCGGRATGSWPPSSPWRPWCRSAVGQRGAGGGQRTLGEGPPGSAGRRAASSAPGPDVQCGPASQQDCGSRLLGGGGELGFSLKSPHFLPR